MKYAAILLSLLFVSCAGKNYSSDVRGPFRATVRMPPRVYAAKPFTLDIRLDGKIPDMLYDPDVGVCLLAVKDGTTIAMSCWDGLPNLRFQIHFMMTREEWIMLRGWERNRLPRAGETEEEVYYEFPYDAGHEQHPDVSMVVGFELWTATPGPGDKPLLHKLLIDFGREVHVDCLDCTQPVTH